MIVWLVARLAEQTAIRASPLKYRELVEVTSLRSTLPQCSKGHAPDWPFARTGMYFGMRPNDNYSNPGQRWHRCRKRLSAQHRPSIRWEADHRVWIRSLTGDAHSRRRSAIIG